MCPMEFDHVESGGNCAFGALHKCFHKMRYEAALDFTWNLVFGRKRDDRRTQRPLSYCAAAGGGAGMGDLNANCGAAGVNAPS